MAREYHVVRIAAAILAIIAIAHSASAASPLPPTGGFLQANGIRLHYLDWGGSGDTILFLPGFNDTAHVYDHFAPRFTDRFHVVGLTRRGVGESDKPKGWLRHQHASRRHTQWASHESSSSGTQWLAMS